MKLSTYPRITGLGLMVYGKHLEKKRALVKNGYTVLVSCHKELREELHDGYILAKPYYLDKDVYLQRYKERGNDEAFIAMMDKNWTSFIELLPHESEYLLVKNNLEDTLLTAITTSVGGDKEGE